MYRRVLLLAVSTLLLASCGAEPIRPRVHVDGTPVESSTTPFPVASIHGRIEDAEALVVALETQATVVTFEAAAGRWLAFVADLAPRAVPTVAWPGEAPSPPSGEGLWRRVEALGLGGDSVLGEDGRAVVVSAGGDLDVAGVVRGMEGRGADLRFLLVVEPSSRYRDLEDGRPPRLAAGDPPWPGSAEAFDAYKEAEIEVYERARAAGRPYEPTRPDLAVLPRSGSGTTDDRTTSDYAVVALPQDDASRVDASWIAHPIGGVGPAGGQAVYYDVVPARQAAFEAWTRHNVGLPLALVVDGEVLSSPVIQSPLRDNVMISLGSDADADEVDRLAARLEASGAHAADTTPADLAAFVRLGDDGTFDVVVRLGEEDTRVRLVALDAAGRASEAVTRTLNRRPNVDASLEEAVVAAVLTVHLGLGDPEAGAAMLRAFGDEAVSALETRLATPSDEDGAVPVWILGRLATSSRAAVDALAGLALRHPSGSVRLEAVRSLGAVVELWPEARKALHDVAEVSLTDDEALEAAALLLADDARREETLLALLPLAEAREPVLRALARQAFLLPPAVETALVDRAREGGTRARLVAANLLGDRDAGPAVVDALLDLLDDDDASVRRAAAQSLALRQALRDPAPPDVPFAEVVGRLDAEHADIRTWAAASLAAYGDAAQEHATRLRELLDDAARDVRVAAAWTLDRVGRGDARSQAILEEAVRAAGDADDAAPDAPSR